MNFRNKITLAEFLFIWSTTFGIYALSLLLNILIAVCIGAFAGWLLSFTFLGNWIASGANSIGLAVTPNDLFKVGSAVGFVTGLTKGQFTIKK